MLQVRRVRVGDVKLETVINRRPVPEDITPGTTAPFSEEGVLMKATTADGGRRSGDWASVHMNLPVNQAVAPGAELVMAVTDEPALDSETPIRFKAVSATPRKGHDDLGHDVVHITEVRSDGMNRLLIAMGDEAGSAWHADVVLSKGQVTSMLEKLLAIYPMLREN